MTTNYSNHRPLESRKSALALEATGRKPFNQDLEEAVWTKECSLPPDWYDEEIDVDQHLRTPTSLTIENISPPAEKIDSPATPLPNVVYNALNIDSEILGQSPRERNSSSSSITTLESEELQHLWNKNILENSDFLMDEGFNHLSNHASSQPNDCLLGERHEGSNWQQNQLHNNPRFEDHSANDGWSAPCAQTVDRSREVDLNENDFIQTTGDFIHQSPPQHPESGIVQNVPNAPMLTGDHLHNDTIAYPTNTPRQFNDVASIELDHGSLKAIDLNNKLYEYQGHYGVFPVTIIDPRYAYDDCAKAYQEALQIARGNVRFEGIIHDDQEIHCDPLETYQPSAGVLNEIPAEQIDQQMEQESIGHKSKSTIDSTLEAVLSSSAETTKRAAGRPPEYAIEEIREGETEQSARERETQKRSREKKSNILKEQREAVKKAYGILQTLDSNSKPAELVKALEAHISMQPGNGKKNKKGPTRTKCKQHRSEAEKLAARRVSGKESASRFRERENEEMDLFRQIIEITFEVQTSQSTKQAIDSAIHELRSAPLGSLRKRAN